MLTSVPDAPSRDLVLTDEYVVELEDLSRLPSGEPTCEEWEALPTSVFDRESTTLLGDPRPDCPHCGSSHFGTLNPRGYLLVRICSDCRGRFRAHESERGQGECKAAEIIGRFFGYRRRFVIDRAENADRYPELAS